VLYLHRLLFVIVVAALFMVAGCSKKSTTKEPTDRPASKVTKTIKVGEQTMTLEVEEEEDDDDDEADEEPNGSEE
jgi:hypothetical protein